MPAARLRKRHEDVGAVALAADKRPSFEFGRVRVGGVLQLSHQDNGCGRLDGKLNRLAHGLESPDRRHESQPLCEEPARQIGQLGELLGRTRPVQQLPLGVRREMRMEERPRFEKQIRAVVLLVERPLLDMPRIPGDIDQAPSAPDLYGIPGMIHVSHVSARPGWKS